MQWSVQIAGMAFLITALVLKLSKARLFNSTAVKAVAPLRSILILLPSLAVLLTHVHNLIHSAQPLLTHASSAL